MNREEGRHSGKNVFLIAGLPENTLRWIIDILETDTSLRPARYVGAPATPNDWANLYKKNSVAEILRLLETESRARNPHRLMVLYVPSRDAEALLSVVDTVCYLVPLTLRSSGLSRDSDDIAWRNDRAITRSIVYEALRFALKSTDALKAEITDKRISAFTLPVRNFYFPNRHSLIQDSYRKFARREFSVSHLQSELLPTRFTRDNLHSKAFKSPQHTGTFFQDSRGRVFPPDIYHAPGRIDEDGIFASELSLHLRQRYRFGVTVRNGDLHYDVQYELPRKLRREPMHCALVGKVLVTGSHANVGVNDVIWTPDGEKEQVHE